MVRLNLVTEVSRLFDLQKLKFNGPPKPGGLKVTQVIYKSRNLMVRLNMTLDQMLRMIYKSRNLMVRLNWSPMWAGYRNLQK